MSDTDITVVGPGASDWMLADADLAGAIAGWYRKYVAALGTYEADVILTRLRALERVSAAIQEAVYAEPEAPDGIDLAKAEREIVEAMA